jgi:hypothetical protein
LVTAKDCAALTPNFTLPYARLLFDRVRSARPVPVSVTCCGLVMALSETISEALCSPIAFGVNETPSVQFVLGARVIGIAPHVPVPLRAYSELDGVALETSSGWVAPVLVTVRFLVTV